MDAYPGPIPLPEPNGMRHGLPRRHVIRTHPPGAPTAHDSEDGVQHLPVRIDAMSPSAWRPFRQSGGNPLPFGIRKVGRIGFSCALFVHTIKDTSKPSTRYISDTL